MSLDQHSDGENNGHEGRDHRATSVQVGVDEVGGVDVSSGGPLGLTEAKSVSGGSTTTRAASGGLSGATNIQVGVDNDTTDGVNTQTNNLTGVSTSETTSSSGGVTVQLRAINLVLEKVSTRLAVRGILSSTSGVLRVDGTLGSWEVLRVGEGGNLRNSEVDEQEEDRKKEELHLRDAEVRAAKTNW